MNADRKVVGLPLARWKAEEKSWMTGWEGKANRARRNPEI